MKSKAPLIMMEQMVMILVFALAAALCLQAFVLSDSLSREGELRDKAVLLCQNTAESYKFTVTSGAARVAPAVEADKYEAGVAYYDENGRQTQEPSVLRLEAQRLPDELPTLGRTVLRVYEEATGKELYSLEFAWQKQEVD